jgi:fimbrial isopeptide formation D2 family protein
MKIERIALSVIVVTAIAALLVSSAAATDNKLLFVPDDSSSTSAGCVNVDVYTDINEVDEATATQFDIEYDPSCVEDYPSWSDGTDWPLITYSNPASGVCRFTTSVGTSPAISGHKMVGTLTLCCNSTCCGSWLNFTNALYTKGDLTKTSPATDNGTFLCGKPVEVTKKVWDGSTWVDDLGPLDSSWYGRDVQFKITVTAGCLDLSNVVVDDTMDDSLVYNNSATPTETSNTTHTATWNIGSLAGSTSQTITFNATIVSYGKDYNIATATATVDLLGVGVSDSDQASEETMPPAGLEVNKTVWDPDAEAWIQNITAVLDYVNIGDNASETGHNLYGFGPIEPATHGGGWGGADDGNLRVIWSNQAPDDGGRNASFTLDNPYLNAKLLQLRVLNGIANDDFDVYVNGDYVYTYIHDPDTTERWVTHSIDVSAYSSQPTLTVEMNATGPAWSGWSTYGQVGVSWAKLLRDSPKIGDTYRFRCEVHNTGAPGMDLTNIEVWDVISPSLEYADTAMLMTPDGVWRSIEPPTSITPYDAVEGTTVNWTIDNFLQNPLVLVPCKTFVVEYDVTVIDYGFDCNVQYARGYAEAAGQWVDNSDDACIDTRYPDLTVTEIEVNVDLSGAIGYAFAHNCNNLSAVIKETNDVDVSDTFYVKFEVDGDEKCTVAVDGIGALEEKTVWCNCSWTPDSIGTVTITVTVDADDDVEEESEANNALDKTQDVIYNGYKGDGWQDGRNITALQCHEQGTINLTYSTGDSYYLSGYSTKWDNYEVHWVPSNFSIPPTESCIKKARLYAYYHGDQYGDKWANLSMVFNGVPKTSVAHYSDGKGFGSWDYSSNYGVLVYDVTNEFLVTSNNIANLTNNNPSEPKGISMEAMLLVVVYNNTETEPDRIIWINEGCDLLSSKYPKYGVNPEEATTYAQFPICVEPIPMNEVVGAKLITVAQTGNLGDDNNRLYFNDDGEWHGLWPDGYVPGTNIGIHEADVRLYLKNESNIATYQDNGDMFAVANAFLVVEKGEGQIEVVAPEDCVGLSEQFDVLINVTPVIPVYGVEYELSFDSSVIHAEWQNEGDFLKQGGASTNVYINTIDNDAGKVSFAVTRTGVSTGATVPGTLATIHFTAVELGANTDLTLTLVKASDPDAQPIPMDTFNSNVAVCDNEPPDAVAKSLFEYNNVGTKYMSKTYFDGSESSDPDGSIINYRWYFGDGNYGTGETYQHIYGSWHWNGASYDPFEVILTVEDNGVPVMDGTDTIPVNVYIAGDANGDGIVDIFDGVTVGLEWDNTANFNGIFWYDNPRGDRADLNNDQIVDIFDGVIVGANWDHTAW